MSTREAVQRWWAYLKTQGVAVSPEQLRAVLLIADELERSGRRDRLLATVEGVLVKNEQDRKLLEAIAVPEPETGSGGGLGPTRSGAGSLHRRAHRERRFALSAMGAALVAGSLAAAAWWSDRNPDIRVVEQPAATLVATPPLAVEGGGLRLVTAEQTLSLRTLQPPEPVPPGVRLAALLAPVLLILGLFWWWRSRGPVWTRLAPDAAEDRINNKLPPAQEPGLFQGGALRSLGRALTARSDEATEAIDVGQTVARTVRHAGLLHLVHDHPLADSPIHLAIERRSRDDHVSELYFRLADRLRAHGALVQVSQYRDDLGSRLDEAGRRVGAPRPDPWQGKALLVTVGSGETLFDPLGVDARPGQIRHIETWPHRALLSTLPVVLWSAREARLALTTMAVAPATSRGLGAVADRVWSDAPLTGLLAVRTVGVGPSS